jgi:hypothetical protein
MLAIAASTLVTGIDVDPGWAAERSGVTLLAQRGGARRGGGGGGGAPGNITIGRVLTQGAVQTTEPATGRVAIKTEGGIIEASFPRPVLAELKPGDVVFVTVDLIDPRVAAVAGSVAAVDASRGTVTVTTPSGALTLRPSADALTRMKVGDPLLLKLELVDIGPPSDAEQKP